MVVSSHDSAEIQHVLREVGPATLSMDPIVPENLFSSYEPKPQVKSSLMHYYQQPASGW
jgi:hypothetical protein